MENLLIKNSMKNLVSFFRKCNDSCDCEVKATMIKAAFNGDWVCDEIVETIICHDATENNVPVILFGLTRATASFLKSLEKSDIHAKRLFDGMLNVWLKDVDDLNYFDKWSKNLRENRLGIR